MRVTKSSFIWLDAAQVRVRKSLVGNPCGQFQPMREYRMNYWDTTPMDRDLYQDVSQDTPSLILKLNN